MTTRAFLAAILGGIAMFIWSFIAHDLLPLGEMGMREFKDEAAVLDALKTNLGDARGLYHFPGHRAGPNATRQEKSDAMKRAMEKAASGPSGLLIYHPSRKFCWPSRICFPRWNSCCDHHERSILELVWLPFQIHRGLHVY